MPGSQDFLFIGGRLAIDLALTGDVAPERVAHERLHTPDDLARWLAAGPLRLEGLAASPDDLAAAKDLREAVWLLVLAQQGRHELPGGPVATVNRYAETPDLAPRLLGYGRQAFSAPNVLATLATIARDTVRLFGDPRQLARLRECAAPDCRIVFYDDSRPGQRRWCSPQRCGDRMRARTYRSRQPSEAGA